MKFSMDILVSVFWTYMYVLVSAEKNTSGHWGGAHEAACASLCGGSHSGALHVEDLRQVPGPLRPAPDAEDQGRQRDQGTTRVPTRGMWPSAKPRQDGCVQHRSPVQASARQQVSHSGYERRRAGVSPTEHVHGMLRLIEGLRRPVPSESGTYLTRTPDSMDTFVSLLRTGVLHHCFAKDGRKSFSQCTCICNL